MSHSKVSLLYLLFGLLAACESQSARPVTPSDLLGTWHIRELDPRFLRQPEVAASYLRFHITLMPNGTVIARDVPAGMFFNWPAANEYSGVWRIDPRSTAETTYLDFILRGPGGKSGTYGTFLDWKNGKRAISLPVQDVPMYAEQN